MLLEVDLFPCVIADVLLLFVCCLCDVGDFDVSEGEHHEVLLEMALFPRVIAAVLLLFVCCLCDVAYFDVS